jgi:hypothetical protein
MSLSYSDETMATMLETFAAVSPELKESLKESWKTEMGLGRPLPVCGTCGIRDVNMKYKSVIVHDLPDIFIIKEGSDTMKQFSKLQNGIDLLMLDEQGNATFAEDGSFKMCRVDLSCVMDFYDSKEGVKYHLHGDLVERDETFACCANCLDLINVVCKKRREKEEDAEGVPGNYHLSRPLALGYAYGNMSKIPTDVLPKLSPLEVNLLCPQRLYQVSK